MKISFALILSLPLFCGSCSGESTGPDDPGTGGGGGQGGSGGAAQGGSGGQGGALDGVCDEPAPGVRYEHEVLEFTGPDSLSLVVTRDYAGQGAGFSTLWRGSRFSITKGTLDSCVTAPERLNYENTHHNWYDKFTATIEALDYTLYMVYDFQNGNVWIDTLTVYEAGSETVAEGPITLSYKEGPPR